MVSIVYPWFHFGPYTSKCINFAPTIWFLDRTGPIVNHRWDFRWKPISPKGKVVISTPPYPFSYPNMQPT